MAELLDQLDRDRLALGGVVTNKAERFTFPLLQGLRLDERAACVVGATPRPARSRIPIRCCTPPPRCNCRPSACLYVGDDLRDVQAARAAGHARDRGEIRLSGRRRGDRVLAGRRPSSTIRAKVLDYL